MRLRSWVLATVIAPFLFCASALVAKVPIDKAIDTMTS